MAAAHITTCSSNPIPVLTPIQTARFWGKVDSGTDFQCWPWTGTQNVAGYGRMVVESTLIPAHRIAYTLINGEIPSGQLVRHRCDNPICCNPKHLETGSYQDNSDDAVQRGRTAYGVKNSRSKLTEEQIKYIRTNPDKLLQKEIAAMFGMATSSISYIVNGRSWKYQ